MIIALCAALSAVKVALSSNGANWYFFVVIFIYIILAHSRALFGGRKRLIFSFFFINQSSLAVTHQHLCTLLWSTTFRYISSSWSLNSSVALHDAWSIGSSGSPVLIPCSTRSDVTCPDALTRALSLHALPSWTAAFLTTFFFLRVWLMLPLCFASGVPLLFFFAGVFTYSFHSRFLASALR